MAEKLQGGFRERVFFTDQMWARIEVMADRLGLDEKTFLRACIGLQLAQLEAELGAAPAASDPVAVADLVKGVEPAPLVKAAPARLAPARPAPARPAPDRPAGLPGPGRGGNEPRQTAPPARVASSFLTGRDGRPL